MNPRPAATGLTFQWPEREGFPWFLFTFVLLSFAAHAASFFIFQAVFPQRATLPQRAPAVHLLTGSTPEERAVLEWIDAEDPALVASASSVTPPRLLDVEYRPSYATHRTAPRSVAEPQSSVQFPAVKSALAIIASAETKSAAARPAREPSPTRVSFSAAIASRALVRPPDPAAIAKAAAPLEPSRYLIGVTDRGEVRFVFLQHSSGDPAFDDAGAARLASATFAPEATPIAWAQATVTWGDDAYSDLKSEIENRKSP